MTAYCLHSRQQAAQAVFALLRYPDCFAIQINPGSLQGMALVVAVKSGTCFIREQTLSSPRHLLATRESRSNVILTDRTVNTLASASTSRAVSPDRIHFEPFHKIGTRLPFLEPPRL